VAVGEEGAVGGAVQTLVESWDGSSWTVVPSPSLEPNTTLDAVACTSANACVAVGLVVNRADNLQTLVESWDGQAWSIVPSPNQGAGDNRLYGVTCTSASACVAVGSYGSVTGPDQTLVESWDGRSWSIIPSPNQGTVNNRLLSVDCSAPNACVAVGDTSNLLLDQTLIESWDGTSWSMVPSPTGATDGFLASVTCSSTGACTAAGADTGSSGAPPYHPLVVTSDGGSWTTVQSPNPTDGLLFGISCSSPSACVAIGATAPFGPPASTLAESWDGTSWSVVPSPSPGINENRLSGIACTSAGRSGGACVAVGFQTDAQSDSSALIEEYR
jgi:hypothetical protein